MSPAFSFSNKPTCLGTTVLWAVVVTSTSTSARGIQDDCWAYGASSQTRRTRCIDATAYESIKVNQDQAILQLEKDVLHWVGLNFGSGFEEILDQFGSDNPELLDMAVESLLLKGLLDFAE